MNKYAPGGIYTLDELQQGYEDLFGDGRPAPPRFGQGPPAGVSNEKRKDNRDRYVFPSQVLVAVSRGDNLAPLIEKARRKRQRIGNVYLALRRFEIKGFGPVEHGALVEARGSIEQEPTFSECTQSVEEQREYPGWDVEIRVLTATPAVRR